jgi:hypothetical protein
MFCVLLGPILLEFVQYLANYTFPTSELQTQVLMAHLHVNECNTGNPMYIQ